MTKGLLVEVCMEGMGVILMDLPHPVGGVLDARMRVNSVAVIIDISLHE